MNFDISSHQEFSKGPICMLSNSQSFCFLCVIISCTVYPAQHVCMFKIKMFTHCFGNGWNPYSSLRRSVCV
ncbi:hypothetical protein Hanom_Chr09g00868051 [Helianthus anomalus]